MNTLITGSSGFIGSVLAKKLSEQGDTLHLFVRDPASVMELNLKDTKIFKGDLGDKNSIAAAMNGCDKVFHCAAYAKLWAKDKNVFYNVNVEGTRNVLEQALQQGVNKVVYTSSTAVWGPNPYKIITEDDPRLLSFDSDYDLSKHLAEQLVKEFSAKGLHTVIVNPSRVYGPGKLSYSNAFTRLLTQAVMGKRVTIPGSDNTIANYAFIDDVANGHILAMEHGLNGERYILGGENISYKKLLEIVTAATGEVKVLKLPAAAMKLIGWFELLRTKITGSEPAFTPKMLNRYFTDMAFSCDKAVQQLGYHITPFEEGLKNTIAYIKNNHHG
jgi:nucleoside-diphosphate-sugar epimerase